MTPVLILGLESSCDDTGVAVYDAAARKILSNKTRSQDAVHAPFGGVVPELASRAHLENFGALYRDALAAANAAPADLGAIAVTRGPGLRGCLAVGVSYARGLGLSLGVPVRGINHIHAHALSPFAESELPPLPHLAAVVSGGHTHFFAVNGPAEFKLLAKTRDDAMGEAFDKVAKLLGLPWPGGPAVDKTAEGGDEERFPFSLPRFNDDPGGVALSFSGLKTAALHRFRESGLARLGEGEAPAQGHRDLCASFQRAAVALILDRAEKLLDRHAFRSLGFSGGAAQNSRLRRLATALGDARALPVCFPGRGLSADNGAMIAACLARAGEAAFPSLAVDPDLKL